MKPVKIRAEWEAEGFGRVLKAARLKYTLENKVSLAAVCKQVGVNRSYWYQMEEEKLRTVSLDHIRATEKLFGVTLVKVSLDYNKMIRVEVVSND